MSCVRGRFTEKLFSLLRAMPSLRRSLSWLVVVVVVGSCQCSEFINFPYGGRNNKLFIPTGYTLGKALPLYVMLHGKHISVYLCSDIIIITGCTQSPDDFARGITDVILLFICLGTEMNEYAEKNVFLVLYPEQTSTANSNKCW